MKLDTLLARVSAWPVQTSVRAWRGQGVKVTASEVPGEPFWRVSEEGINPALEDATLKNMQSA